MRLIDLTGQPFGRLTVLKRWPVKQGKHVLWLCRCSCQREVRVRSQHLRKKRIKSCGKCGLTKGHLGYNALEPGQASFHLFVKHVYQGAALRNLAQELSLAQMHTLAQQPCIYCGRSQTTTHGKNMLGVYKHNGIDRLDNAVGYTVENSVPCCTDCNRAKGVLSYAAFLAWVENVYNKNLLW